MKYEFKGWDWHELIPVLDMEAEYEEFEQTPPGMTHKADEALGEKLAGRIQGYSCSHNEEEVKELIVHLRAFLQLIVDTESMGHYKPYYQGILDIENDEVFLHLYARNVQCMWT